MVIIFSMGDTRTARLIRFLGRSEFAHVAFGDAYWICTTSLRGDTLWPPEQYLRLHPTAAWLVIVPTPRPVITRALRSRRPISHIPTFIRWLAGPLGRFVPTRDCVQQARRALAAGGIPSPPVTTPAQLFDWLRGEGFEFLDLSGECTVDWPKTH